MKITKKNVFSLIGFLLYAKMMLWGLGMCLHANEIRIQKIAMAINEYIRTNGELPVTHPGVDIAKDVDVSKLFIENGVLKSNETGGCFYIFRPKEFNSYDRLIFKESNVDVYEVLVNNAAEGGQDEG